MRPQQTNPNDAYEATQLTTTSNDNHTDLAADIDANWNE